MQPASPHTISSHARAIVSSSPSDPLDAKRGPEDLPLALQICPEGENPVPIAQTQSRPFPQRVCSMFQLLRHASYAEVIDRHRAGSNCSNAIKTLPTHWRISTNGWFAFDWFQLLKRNQDISHIRSIFMSRLAVEGSNCSNAIKTFPTPPQKAHLPGPLRGSFARGSPQRPPNHTFRPLLPPIIHFLSSIVNARGSAQKVHSPAPRRHLPLPIAILQFCTRLPHSHRRFITNP